MNRSALIFLVLFLIGNALKIALFSGFVVYMDAELLGFKFGLSLCLIIPLYLLMIRCNIWIFVVWYLLQYFYLFAQLSYFETFHRYLHVLQVTFLYKEGLEIFSRGGVKFSAQSLFLLIDLPFLIGVLYYASSLKRAVARAGFKKMALLSIGCLLGCLIMLVPFFRFGTTIPVWIQRSGEVWTVKYLGTAGNAIVQLFQEKTQANIISQIKYGPEQTFAGSGAAAKPNFVLVQLESVDANSVHMRFQGEPVMPFLDSLASACVYYRYFLSTHGAGATSDIDFTILNSTSPQGTIPMLGLTYYDFPNSFIHQLKPAYPKCLGFHNNKGQYFNREMGYPKMGFDTLFDMINLHLKENGWGAPDHELLDVLILRLKHEPRPFLYYFVTMSSHEPYTNVPRYYRDPRFKGVASKIMRDYLSSMAYVDREMRRLISAIESQAPDTYVMLFGDHCPPYIGKEIAPEIFIPSAMIRDNIGYEFTPLYIITPDKRNMGIDTVCATMVDIGPTVLAASGIACTYLSDGADLLDTAALTDEVWYMNKTLNRRQLVSALTK